MNEKDWKYLDMLMVVLVMLSVGFGSRIISIGGILAPLALILGYMTIKSKITTGSFIIDPDEPEPRPVEREGEHSYAVWYLLSLVFTFGGLLAFIFLRKKSRKAARNCLIIFIIHMMWFVPTVLYINGLF